MKVLLPVNGATTLWHPVQCSVRRQAHHWPRCRELLSQFPGLSAADARPSQAFGGGENHLCLISWKDKHNDDIQRSSLQTYLNR